MRLQKKCTTAAFAAFVLGILLVVLSIVFTSCNQNSDSLNENESVSKKKDTVPSDIVDAFKKAGLPVLKEKILPKDFTLDLVDGNSVTLSALKGKVVFLNLWATWCPPCRAEMPSMEILYQRFKNDGLELLAVDLMENKDTVQKFLAANKLTFPAALDTEGAVGSDYNAQAIPVTYIIDRDGQAIISSVGGRNWDTPAMLSAFETLLRNGQ